MPDGDAFMFLPDMAGYSSLNGQWKKSIILVGKVNFYNGHIGMLLRSAHMALHRLFACVETFEWGRQFAFTYRNLDIWLGAPQPNVILG